MAKIRNQGELLGSAYSLFGKTDYMIKFKNELRPEQTLIIQICICKSPLPDFAHLKLRAMGLNSFQVTSRVGAIFRVGARKMRFFQSTVNYSYTGYSVIPEFAHTGLRIQSRAETAHSMFRTVWYSDIPDFREGAFKFFPSNPGECDSNTVGAQKDQIRGTSEVIATHSRRTPTEMFIFLI